MLLGAVERSIARHAMVARGDRVLVAVSGGPDSMALLDALGRLRGRLGIELRVATVDHGLRAAAAAEAEAVRAFAASRGIEADVLRASLARASQDSARRARLALLASCARDRGCARVALGHTRSDQAETVLMRVIRGAGVRGLAGIPPVRGVFVRPLLDVPRAAVERYVARRALPVVRDPSNEDPRFLRARIRREILPLLRRENPRIEEALAAIADAAREAAGDAIVAPLMRAHLATLADLLRAPGGTKTLDLGSGLRATVRVDRVPAPVPVSVPVDHAIPSAGRYEIPSARATLILDAAPAFPLRLRSHRPGDRIRLGVGTRKISDILVDAKVPREQRSRTLLLCDGDRVLFVAAPGVTRAAIGDEIRATIEWR